MALVAVDAVVDISRHVVVLEIVGVVAAVASGALENGVVIGIRVARGAHVIRTAVVGRELSVLPVIKRGPRPGCRVVAGLAGGREKLRLRGVPWIRRIAVIRLVATDAVRWQCRVVVVDMAIAALARRDGVRSGQRKRGVVVVERRVGPHDCVMADLARSGESSGRMRRIVGARIIFLMARVAEDAVQRVVVVNVAIAALARRHGMRSG